MTRQEKIDYLERAIKLIDENPTNIAMCTALSRVIYGRSSSWYKIDLSEFMISNSLYRGFKSATGFLTESSLWYPMTKKYAAVRVNLMKKAIEKIRRS